MNVENLVGYNAIIMYQFYIDYKMNTTYQLTSDIVGLIVIADDRHSAIGISFFPSSIHSKVYWVPRQYLMLTTREITKWEDGSSVVLLDM